MFYNPAEFPWALPFYQMVPWQIYSRTDAMPIDAHVAVRGRGMNLLSLLRSMASRLGPGGEALIVTHGMALGLSMRLVEGSSSTCDVRVIDLLNSQRPAGEISGPLQIDERQVQQILEAAQGIRALSLQRVELRACNLGGSSSWMQAFKRLLGPGTLGAPTALNAYGKLEPGRPSVDQAYWRRWQDRFPNERVYELSAGGRVALAPATGLHRGRVDTLATSEAAVIDWVRVHLARNLQLGARRNWRQVPYHAIFRWTETFPMVWHGATGYSDFIVHV